jgi:nucleotide-binding universal stress UspA family protein
MKPTEVIVGVDSSAPSRSALRWAAAEAARRGTRLRIVHAYHSHWPQAAYNGEQAEKVATIEARKVFDAAVAEARQHAPAAEVIGGYVLSGAAAALLEAAESGDLVVVGSRGHSQFAATFAGSTCQQVAFHATASVTVVRGRADTAAGPVVVGFDGSAASEPALGTAFEEAAARGCGLTVVRVYRPGTPAWPADADPPDVFNPQTVRTALTDELGRILQPLVDKYPNVPVERRVHGGDAAQVLVEASREAQLIVVGSRGHGGFVGLLLGSVGMHLLHHADCPVLIARG